MRYLILLFIGLHIPCIAQLQKEDLLRERQDTPYLRATRNNPKELSPSVLKILQGGRLLKQTDHSRWKIHPDDAHLTLGWTTMPRVNVDKTSNKRWPYVITNQETSTRVRAKKITKSKENSFPKSL